MILDTRGHAVSEKLHVIERFTRTDEVHMSYEATNRRSQGIHQALEEHPDLGVNAGGRGDHGIRLRGE
jgi:hypothetical protein